MCEDVEEEEEEEKKKEKEKKKHECFKSYFYFEFQSFNAINTTLHSHQYVH